MGKRAFQQIEQLGCLSIEAERCLGGIALIWGYDLSIFGCKRLYDLSVVSALGFNEPIPTVLKGAS